MARRRPARSPPAAVVCSALALTAGIADGVRPAVVDRLSGDDITAMLAAAAGAVLLAVGVVTLWRARRRDGGRARRYGRRAALAVAALVVALYLVVPTGIAMDATHRAHVPAEAADLGRPHERVTLTTGTACAWPAGMRHHAIAPQSSPA
jgi:hypothetical protein